MGHDKAKGAVLKTLTSGQAVFSVLDPALRREIRKALESLGPHTEKSEPHCDYSLRLTQCENALAVKQYRSGVLQVQGKDGPLFRDAMATIGYITGIEIPPLATKPGGIDSATKPKSNTTRDDRQLTSPPGGYPYIGIDESGKGDYFGPLVIAAVYLDEDAAQRLAHAGVRDSKTVTDAQCGALADQIKKTLPGRYQVVEISPKQYNLLYREFREENKNLNDLLAWGHARALENLLENVQCQYAVSDKFGNENIIKSRLMSRGRDIHLIQEPRAEQYAAVAAASIIARDRFLSKLEIISQEVGTNLPKGASSAVIEAARKIVETKGETVLAEIAKLHFKTTTRVLDRP
ncbi:MAG: ribonuclease HIII [Bacillota bacterium]